MSRTPPRKLSRKLSRTPPRLSGTPPRLNATPPGTSQKHNSPHMRTITRAQYNASIHGDYRSYVTTHQSSQFPIGSPKRNDEDKDRIISAISMLQELNTPNPPFFIEKKDNSIIISNYDGSKVVEIKFQTPFGMSEINIQQEISDEKFSQTIVVWEKGWSSQPSKVFDFIIEILSDLFGYQCPF